MNIGPVEDAPIFNNAFVLNAMRDELTTGARTMIHAWRGPGTQVVVTHGENILLMLGLRQRMIAVASDPTSQKKILMGNAEIFISFLANLLRYPPVQF